jgi:tetratricopeptide (TPR) repeat protein
LMVETTYTVNLLSPVPEQLRATVALQLAEKFNVSIAKMNRLLTSVQGPITKPIIQKDAEKIAKVLGQAGINVAVVRSDLNQMLLIAEEPLMTREDRYELRELLADLPDTMPVASRLEEPALSQKPERATPIASNSVASKPSKPISRPMVIAILSLLSVVLTVAFGVRIMSPERPLLPTQILSPFEQGMAASTSGDYAKALELWQSLADPKDDSSGDVNAQFELAWLYTNGLGTTKDLEKAAQYFTKAATQGHVEAQNKLGQLYLYGQGVTQDRAQAIKWLSAAGEGGWGDAQFTLGQLYLKGEGTEVNLVEADKWLNLAAKQGVKGADEALSDLMRLQAVENVGSTNADMFAAVEKNDPQAIIGAVLAGADVNARSQDGYTPLMYAVAKGNPEVVREVLSGGADVNIQSTTGWTALMFAAKDKPQMLELLLEFEPNLTLKNNVGQTAHDIAKMFQPSSAELLAQ